MPLKGSARVYLDHTFKPDVTARRVEVITETARRRWFSKELSDFR